MDKA